MPAAMVPRPWDFPVPPTLEVPTDPTKDKEKGKLEQPVTKLPPGQGVLLPPGPFPMLPKVSTVEPSITSPDKSLSAPAVETRS